MAKAIMIQGTASSAGKSLLTAGLCRVFMQDGYKVVPFKSQNMALNSFITREGLEMGRAQVMQAEAAGAEPTVRMNPILLKPTNDTGSQVILNGIPCGTMKASDYFAYKSELVPYIMTAYKSLAQENDIIVIEGAGSPAEINLMENDIVNMGMAKMAGAPVILVGDIDRGGVFASLYGTVKLLNHEEQNIIKGLIINKFRGDVDILSPGIEPLENMTGKKILGVVPMLDVDVDDEDSLTERFNRSKKGLIDIAVIRLPRISNFTDFIPLECVNDVTVRYIASVRDIGNPDVIILPGTKSTIDDLRWLKETGLFAAILKYESNGGAVVGICGGYQMLGNEISDPESVESGGYENGLGLLSSATLFSGEKARTRVAGFFKNSSGVFAGMQGIRIEGYEIHMGITNNQGGINLVETRDVNGDKKEDGLCSGNVFGCYIHGLFDSAECANAFVNCLRINKGLNPEDSAVDWETYKQSQYDKLADGLRASLKMEKIYEILDKGI